MSKATGSKPEDERRRTTSNNPPRNDEVPAANDNTDVYDDQQQEQPDKSPLPSGRTSELQQTDRNYQVSNQSERESDEKKLENLQKKVNQKMAIGRLRQAVRQQDEQTITSELDYINEKHPELNGLKSVKEAEVLLEILEAARDLKNSCDKRDVEEIKRAIKVIEGNKERRFQEMLQSQVREAKYVIEGLTKAPVRRGGRLQVDVHAFNELRRYAKPPPGVLPTMQAVFLLFRVHEGRTETWPDVQRLCKPNGPYSLYSRVLNLKVDEVDPEFAARAREIILFGKDHRANKKGDKKTKTEREEETHESEEAPAPEAETAAEFHGELEKEDDDRKLEYSAATSRESNKELDAENKTGGIDIERLRTTCPVAWTLLLWVLDIVKKVECLPGMEGEMKPADLKRQQLILGLRMKKQPKMDRQYYHILAKNSMAPSYQQQHGIGLYGGQSYRNTFPPRRQTHAREYDYDSSSPRKQDDDDAAYLRTWRTAGVYRDSHYDRSRDHWDREN